MNATPAATGQLGRAAARLSPALGLPTTATAPFCPAEVQGTVAVPAGGALSKRLVAVLGPALLVAVGYMDPGNWATDIEAGSRLGADLLFVVIGSGLMAIFFQTLAARLGLAGLDLAQACRTRYGPRVRVALWGLAELAIIATDVAEVLGAALALKLLLRIPMAMGVGLTSLDLLLVLGLKGVGFRRVEAIILALITVIAASLMVNLALSPPSVEAVAAGLRPSLAKLAQPDALYLAVGIIGATIMPHNLYLHSSIVQTRKVAPERRRDALRLNTIDILGSLFVAMLVNGAILMLAAAAFHAHGRTEVASIEDAYSLLAPVTGTALAGAVFAVGLLAAGQSSTFTGTIAGQVVLEGFLAIRIPCWQRRVVTRVVAVLPALAGVLWLGDGGVGPLLVFSQVVLAAQLPFALYPLIRITGDRAVMGALVTPAWLTGVAWALFAVLAAADVWLLAYTLHG
ncbi:MAG: Mn2+/Fe2+ transporter, family [Caulobacteraceae bacterium]|nr:Mn2+/Fe2+ transporter, family [Caulobacteraceae bacterium]